MSLFLLNLPLLKSHLQTGSNSDILLLPGSFVLGRDSLPLQASAKLIPRFLVNQAAVICNVQRQQEHLKCFLLWQLHRGHWII